MDSRAKIYVPDPDYDSSSSELPSLSDLPPIVKNSHGNRKSLDVIPKSNNRGEHSNSYQSCLNYSGKNSNFERR